MWCGNYSYCQDQWQLLSGDYDDPRGKCAVLAESKKNEDADKESLSGSDEDLLINAIISDWIIWVPSPCFSI